MKSTESRRDRRRRELHERILASAIELFDEKGIEGTTIDLICEHADVAQKTFFNHFPTRQHLVAEIAERFVERLLDLFEESRRQSGSTIDRLGDFFQRVGRRAEQGGPMHREVVFQAIRVQQAKGSGTATARRLEAEFKALLREGVNAGDITREHSIEALTDLVLGTFFVIMLGWASIERYPLRQRLAAAARLLRDALRPGENDD